MVTQAQLKLQFKFSILNADPGGAGAGLNSGREKANEDGGKFVAQAADWRQRGARDGRILSETAMDEEEKK